MLRPYTVTQSDAVRKSRLSCDLPGRADIFPDLSMIRRQVARSCDLEFLIKSGISYLTCAIAAEGFQE